MSARRDVEPHGVNDDRIVIDVYRPPTPDAQRDRAAKPRLSAQWRLVITLAHSGIIVCAHCTDQRDAVERGRRCGHNTWHIEKRYVTPWEPTTAELRAAIVEAHKPRPRREVDAGAEVEQER
jgi:hypothetical protein